MPCHQSTRREFFTHMTWSEQREDVESRKGSMGSEEFAEKKDNDKKADEG